MSEKTPKEPSREDLLQRIKELEGNGQNEHFPSQRMAMVLILAVVTGFAGFTLGKKTNKVKSLKAQLAAVKKEKAILDGRGAMLNDFLTRFGNEHHGRMRLNDKGQPAITTVCEFSNGDKEVAVNTAKKLARVRIQHALGKKGLTATKFSSSDDNNKINVFTKDIACKTVGAIKIKPAP